MKNGKHTPATLDDLTALLRVNNGLLIEQMNHLITMRAHMEAIMIFLPSCESAEGADKATTMRLIRAWNMADKRLRKEASKRLKKLGI